ncbi:MAG TPA: type II toxin-antitoxin system VapC family toxin [Thermoflexus sp.]|nr:type II toxin-antitoxin system VapC family toxin [Thermoflexus sp.]
METVVIDANFGVALLCPLPYSLACRNWLEEWLRRGVNLVAPILWDYEIASALRKQWAQNLLTREAVLDGLVWIFRLPVQRISPDQELLRRALLWAERLGQMTAYDAQYLAVSEWLGAPFWTADQKLYHRCREIGADWVNLVE